MIKVQDLFFSFLYLVPSYDNLKYGSKYFLENSISETSNTKLKEKNELFHSLEICQKIHFCLLSVVSESFFQNVYSDPRSKKNNSEEFFDEFLFEFLGEGTKEKIFLKNKNDSNNKNYNKNRNDNNDANNEKIDINNIKSLQNKTTSDNYDQFENHSNSFEIQIQVIADILYGLANPYLGDKSLSLMPDLFFNSYSKKEQNGTSNIENNNSTNNKYESSLPINEKVHFLLLILYY